MITRVQGQFDVWLEQRRYAPKTRRMYTHYVRRAAEFCDLDTATTDDLAEFMATVPGTAPSQIGARKALVAYYRFRRSEPNPASKLPTVPEPRRLPRPLTEDDHYRWVASAHTLGGMHEAAGVMLASTGCRITELRSARWVDLSLTEPAWWRIRGKAARRAGPQWRQQPLHPAAVPVLEALPRVGDWVFATARGPLGDAAMRAVLIDIGEHAGLGRVLPHRLRHSVGTLALSRTGNLRTVQELLGHRSIASTVIYTQVLPDRLRDVVTDLPV